MAKINFMTSTSRSEISPSVALETPEHMRKETLWTPSLTCDSDTQSSSEDEQVSPIALFNEAMKTHENKMTEPLTFQLTSDWDGICKEEQEVCIEKATEACKVICKIIAPNASNELSQAMKLTEPGISEDLEGLMIAYQNAPTRNLKLQILSLDAHRYLLKMLKKIHEPYGKITTWQIKMARQHARENGPGNIVSNLQIARTFMQYNFG